MILNSKYISNSRCVTVLCDSMETHNCILDWLKFRESVVSSMAWIPCWLLYLSIFVSVRRLFFLGMIGKVLVWFFGADTQGGYGFSIKFYKLVGSICGSQVFHVFDWKLHSKEFLIGENYEVLWRIREVTNRRMEVIWFHAKCVILLE